MSPLAFTPLDAIKNGRFRSGFTLIELSIVLVIIGLIVGGVLVGQSLISAAEVRAQITQIEKYNTAVNTFKNKFNYLPGDMTGAVASQYGFTVGGACNGAVGQRNGDGLIDGYPTGLLLQAAGETALFWQDLSSNSAGNLIDGSFPNGATTNGCGAIQAALTYTSASEYYPFAKIGHGNYVYVYDSSGSNWYGISAITGISQGSGTLSSNATLSVAQSYNIDKKMDDGLPLSGNVQANYLNGSTSTVQTAPNTTAPGGTSSSCYDTATSTYSVTYNNGNGGNCALSFKMQ